MKAFGLLKVWMPLVGMGALLVLAPQSRAQSDMSPDHFDENGIQDVWSVTGKVVKPNAATPKGKATASAAQTRGNKPKTSARLQGAARKPSDAVEPKVVAVQDKRKVATTPGKQ